MDRWLKYGLIGILVSIPYSFLMVLFFSRRISPLVVLIGIMILFFIIGTIIGMKISNKKGEETIINKRWKTGVFYKKFAIIYTIVLTILNLFLVWSFTACKDLGCLGVFFLGMLTGISEIFLLVQLIIGREIEGEAILIIIAFISTFILIPIYYWVGKLIGRFLSWIGSKFKKNNY